MSCLLGFSRFALIVLSIAFLLGGLVLVGGGIYVLVTLGNASSLVSVSLPIGIIVVGGVVTFLAFFVCLSARKDSKPLLFCSWFIILAVLLAQAGVAIAIFIERNNVEGRLTDAWNAASPTTQTNIEKSFGCCGWNNATAGVQPCGSTKTDPPDCQTKLDNLFRENLFAIAIAAIALVGVELFALLMICCMIRGLKHHHHDEYDKLY